MLNLIDDAWIPVIRTSGPDIIRPDQIAEPDVLFPDWQRADLNLACIELLIGLIYLACPPVSIDDWKTRKPDKNTLRKALDTISPAFNLLGEGPLFMQDYDQIDGSPKSPDMLFIDSSGSATARKNADLMVRRNRYLTLDAGLAAMALYTLQAFAPAGGSGNRTSMRGGGPLVTIVHPESNDLWSLVWANVPQGRALCADELEELPWMRPTETSENNQITPPPDGEIPHPEVFFGQPRRIRLVAQDGIITGVIQKRHGTNYDGWIHPLSPYYHHKNQVLPKHPSPGNFGYRNWRGIVLQNEGADRASCLERFLKHREGDDCRLIVGGWAMSNMNPLDFLWSEPPVFPLSTSGEELASRLVDAAEQAAYVLANAIKQSLGEAELKSGVANRAREQLFTNTQSKFETFVRQIANGEGGHVSENWLKVLVNTSMSLFDGVIMPGFMDLPDKRRWKAIQQRNNLNSTFRGYGGMGKKLFKALDMDLPNPKRKSREISN